MHSVRIINDFAGFEWDHWARGRKICKKCAFEMLPHWEMLWRWWQHFLPVLIFPTLKLVVCEMKPRMNLSPLHAHRKYLDQNWPVPQKWVRAFSMGYHAKSQVPRWVPRCSTIWEHRYSSGGPGSWEWLMFREIVLFGVQTNWNWNLCGFQMCTPDDSHAGRTQCI